jgi:hypothetical protein
MRDFTGRNRRAAIAIASCLAAPVALAPAWIVSAQAQNPAPIPGMQPAATADSRTAPATLSQAIVTQTATGIAVENLTLTLASVVYRVPRVELRGTALSPADVSTLLDAASSDPLAERLNRLEASEIAAPEIIAEQTIGSTRQVTTYRDVLLANVKDGRIASASSAGGRFEVTGAPGASQGTFSRLGLDDFDLGLTVALYAGTGRAEADAPRRLYSGFALEGVVLSDATGATTRIARLASGEVLARASRNGLGAATQALGAIQTDLGKADIAERRRIYGILGDLLGAFEFRSLEASGFTFSDGKSTANTGRIARIAYTGATEARSTEIRLDGLEVLSDTGHVRIGSIAIGGLSLTPFLNAARDLSDLGNDGPDPAQMRKFIPATGTLRISDIAFDQPAEKAATEPGPGNFAIGTIEIVAEKPVDNLPSDLRIALRDVGFPVPPAGDEGGMKDLAELGYSRVDASLGIAAGWNESRQEIVLRDLSLRSPTMGSLTLSGVIGNVPRDAFNRDSAIAMVALAGATAKSLDITIDNRGLYERILQRQAKREKRSTEDLRREYGVAAAIGVPAVLGNSASSRALGSALARFAAQPGRLAIQAQAKDPAGLGIVDVMGNADPTALLDRLDIKAAAQ